MPVLDDVFEVRVLVNGQVVAQSVDVALCMAVLNRLTGNKGGTDLLQERPSGTASAPMAGGGTIGGDEALAKFTELIGVDSDIVRGACDPSSEEPYLHLDLRTWADWAKKMPERGKASISAATLAATLLSLWFHCAGLGAPNLRASQAILTNIGVLGRNPSRSVKNCDWLQLRPGGTVRVNPASFGKAIEVVKAFCERRVPQLREN